jgi:malate dehydrogenase
MAKVTVIGTGLVGATAAQRLAARRAADVVLLDVDEGPPLGSMSERTPGLHPTSTWADTAGSDVVILATGGPDCTRITPGESIAAYAPIVEPVAREAALHSPDATMLIATGPADAMTRLVCRATGLPPRRVLGVANAVVSLKLASLIADELRVGAADVRVLVLGGCGPHIVPLLRCATVGGVPLANLLTPERIVALCRRAAHAGTEAASVVDCATAAWAPGAAAAALAGTIVTDRRRLVSCTVHSEGRYGLDDVPVGLPALIGRGGVQELLELPLYESELEALTRAAAIARKRIDALDAWRQSVRVEAPAAGA